MIVHRMPQHIDGEANPAWLAARLGVATASRFADIITPAKMQLSKSADGYLAELCAEYFIGEPCGSDASSPWMNRGTDFEDAAREWFEWEHDCDVEQVGFVTRDDGLIGCSPDGLVGEHGGVEFKVPSAAKHIAYTLDPQRLVNDYKLQIFGCMYVCERTWWTIVSYNPVMPAVVVRVGRDLDYMSKLSDALDAFAERMLAARETLVSKGFSHTPPKFAYVDSQACTAIDGGLSCGMTGVEHTPDGWRCELHKGALQ